LPAKIHACGGRYGYKDQGQTPNTVVATYEFDDGTELVCDVRGRFSNQEAGQTQGVIFYGSKGHMVFGSNANAGAQLFLENSKQPDPEFGKQDNENFNLNVLHMKSFLDAIRAEKPAILTDDINETYLSTAYCLLGNISYRTGRKLTLDAHSGRFVADEEASRMLSAPHRKPFALPEKL
jgi:hypothetical protein